MTDPSGPDADADTGAAEAAAATEIPPVADPESIPAVTAASRSGLPPLVWGGLLVAGVAALLAWQLT